MRALLICAAPMPDSAGLIAELARYHDRVIAVDGGASLCLDAGVRPDLIIGDLDSISPQTADYFAEQGVEVQRFSEEKDETDLDLALDAAREAEAESITITAISTGRLDHALAALGSIARHADLAPSIVEPDLTAWLLSSSVSTSLVLEGHGSAVSVFALLEPATISLSGTHWPLHDRVIAPLDSLGISNRISGHQARVDVHEGCVLVLSPRLGRTPPAHTAL